MRVTRCEYFYHKVHGDGVKWLCFWGHWGISEMFWMCSEVVKLWSCEDVILKYFALWRDSSLRCASFRMTRLYILLMIRNLFQWENCFWIAKIFFWIAFLSELSWRNSFAMKLYGNCYLNSFFITKFSVMWWKDGVFWALRNIGTQSLESLRSNVCFLVKI